MVMETYLQLAAAAQDSAAHTSQGGVLVQSPWYQGVADIRMAQCSMWNAGEIAPAPVPI
jgi:hypothetical protein